MADAYAMSYDVISSILDLNATLFRFVVMYYCPSKFAYHEFKPSVYTGEVGILLLGLLNPGDPKDIFV